MNERVVLAESTLEEAFGDPMATLSDLDLAEFDATVGERTAEPRLGTALLDEDLPEGGDSAPRTRDRERN